MQPGGQGRAGEDMSSDGRHGAGAVAQLEDNRPPSRERRAEEPVKGAVGGVDADARRRRMRLDVRRTGRSGVEPGIGPRRRPREGQLQGGEQE